MTKRLSALLCVLLLAIFVAVAHALWPSPQARERSLAGWQRERLEREAEKGSRDPVLFHTLARRRMEAGDFPAAGEALEEALRLNPKFTRARATLGTVLMALDQDAEAVLQLKQAIQDDPTSADAYLGLALLYQRNEAWALQAQAAEIVTQLEPRKPDGWILRGEAVAQQGDHQKAAELFEKAAELAPKQARPRVLASAERLALGQFEPAQSLAEAAVRLEPKYAPGWTALGNVLLRQGPAEHGEAEKAYASAVSYGDDSGQAHLGLGRTLQLLKRPTEAEQQFRLAVRSHPELTEAHYGLSQVLREQGKEPAAAAAEKEFQRWVRFKEQATKLHDRLVLNPDAADDWFALAQLYAGMGLDASARRFTLSGLRRAPAHPQGKKLLEQIDRNAG